MGKDKFAQSTRAASEHSDVKGNIEIDELANIDAASKGAMALNSNRIFTIQEKRVQKNRGTCPLDWSNIRATGKR